MKLNKMTKSAFMIATCLLGVNSSLAFAQNKPVTLSMDVTATVAQAFKVSFSDGGNNAKYNMVFDSNSWSAPQELKFKTSSNIPLDISLSKELNLETSAKVKLNGVSVSLAKASSPTAKTVLSHTAQTHMDNKMGDEEYIVTITSTEKNPKPGTYSGVSELVVKAKV